MVCGVCLQGLWCGVVWCGTVCCVCRCVACTQCLRCVLCCKRLTAQIAPQLHSHLTSQQSTSGRRHDLLYIWTRLRHSSWTCCCTCAVGEKEVGITKLEDKIKRWERNAWKLADTNMKELMEYCANNLELLKVPQ